MKQGLRFFVILNLIGKYLKEDKINSTLKPYCYKDDRVTVRVSSN